MDSFFVCDFLTGVIITWNVDEWWWYKRTTENNVLESDIYIKYKQYLPWKSMLIIDKELNFSCLSAAKYKV